MMCSTTRSHIINNKKHVHNIMGIFWLPLRISNILGINHYRINKNGIEYSNACTKLPCTISAILFILLTLYELTMCKYNCKTCVQNITFKILLQILLFYNLANIPWLIAKNKRFIQLIQKIVIIDTILQVNLQQRVNYRKNKMWYCVRSLFWFGYRLSYFLWSFYRMIKYQNFNNIICSLGNCCMLILVFHINCVLYLVIYELKDRLRILNAFLASIYATERHIEDVKIVHSLLVRMVKEVSYLFGVHIAIDMMILLLSSLIFAISSVDFQMETFLEWMHFIHYYLQNDLCSVLELVLIIYIFESFKSLVSFIIKLIFYLAECLNFK